MIEQVKVTNHLGESMVLPMRSPEQSGFFIRGIDGLGPVNSTINMTDVLAIQGGIFNSSKLNRRNIVLSLGFYDKSLSAEEIRLKSYKYFPMNKEITFEITTDSRVGITRGYVESNEPDIFSKESATIISMLCPSAYFFEEDVVQTIFSGVIPGFEFPWSNESTTLSLIEFGDILISKEGTLFYTGDDITGVKIYVHIVGNVNDLTLYNVTAKQIMAIDSSKLTAILGSDLVAGDDIFINTLKGEKEITLTRAGVEYNILNSLDLDADWFTIEPGDNVFAFTADSGDSYVQMMVEHQILYTGV